MSEAYLKLIESLAKDVVAAAISEDSFEVFADGPKTELQQKITEMARHLKYRHEHDDGCLCELLEQVEYKPIENPGPLPNFKKVIMCGGTLPSEADDTRRYWEDPRKTGLKNGLRQLTVEQLERVINYSGEMVLDAYNYEDGKFCPLAIGLGLDVVMADPTHDRVFELLTYMGYKVYNTRGIPGEFYTTNRKEDLLEAAREVLQEKINQNANQ